MKGLVAKVENTTLPFAVASRAVSTPALTAVIQSSGTVMLLGLLLLTPVEMVAKELTVIESAKHIRI
ncbi:hypothetical protein [Klebsiella pneumoniae]|uniref:hypothetical protein n=1 Tax=Klebsiella pneumoniae TaxID=573 RepID=UPI000F618935|nr:hypothetical protein [Klebsiella pneumoniae]